MACQKVNHNGTYKRQRGDMILASIISGGGSTGLNSFFEKDEDREEIAQWQAIKELKKFSMKEADVKLYILENNECT